MNEGGKCPVTGRAPAILLPEAVLSIRDWWPNQLNLKMLHQNSEQSNPNG